MMRPPASESENRTHGAKKIGPRQYSDFFNKIDQARSLFNLAVAASPRQADGFKPGTVMFVADGDFSYSPMGVAGSGGEILYSDTMKEADAKDLANNGYVVFRIPEKTSVGIRVAQTVMDAAFPLRLGSISQFPDEFAAHTLLHEMSKPLSKVILYTGDTQPVEIKTTTLSSILEQVTQHPALLNGSAEERRSAVAEIREQKTWLTPTEGLGGISLNGIAEAPFSSGDVQRARFDEKNRHIVLTMRGEVSAISIALPNLSTDALRSIYQSVYVDDERPEISIGSRPNLRDARLDDQTKRRAAGGVPVYYLGGTEGTELGQALYLADQALGDLTFGSTATIQQVENKVIGFHSLPEVFIEKYTSHPTQNVYLGDSTVYANLEHVQIVPIRSFWSRIWPFASGLVYELSTPTFAIRFGQDAGPAEAAFATFFTSHFYEIANTELGRPLLELVPFAQAVALFRWLRANDISLNTEALEVKAHPVSTPLKVPLSAIVYPSDVRPLAPLTVFSALGPREIYDSNGRKTIVRYEGDLPVEASRYDGTKLRIIRDAMGTPAVVTDGVNSLAFDVGGELGLIVATDVSLKEEGLNVATRFTMKTVVYPLSEREAITCTVIARFATRSDDSWMRVED